MSSSLKRQPSQSQTSMPAWTKTVLPTSSITYPNKVKAMVQGRDRRPELAYKLALECRQSDAFLDKKQIHDGDGDESHLT